MRLRPIVTALAASVLAAGILLPASDASAAADGRRCAKTATITKRSGSGYVYWYGKEAQNGAKYTAKTMKFGYHFFETHGIALTLSWGRSTYRIGSGAVFLLDCSGRSKKEGLIFTSLKLFQGKVSVRSTKNHEGSIRTKEGLFGQEPYHAGTSFAVARTRTSKKAATFQNKVDWYSGSTKQPNGTTTVKKLAKAKINVTPYVGAKVGTCRVVRSATLTSTNGRGKAVYHF